MKNILLAGLCLFIINGSGVLFAQNKTLGVGVTTPNPNAALHVESPTGNQGFIMPRLTTAQRDQMVSLLSSADIGLMLYDTDLSTIFLWNGASWERSSQFIVDNPASVDDALDALTMGSGSAGRFTINNTASFAHAVYAENNGDSTSAAVHGNHLGQGFGVFGKSAGSKFASAAVYGEHVGTGDAAGAFRISNAANTYSALYGETNGSGPAVYGNQSGLGRGGQFQITNTSNTQTAIRGYTAGTGNAGFYTINNAANDSSAIYSTTNGTGPAIAGLSTGTGPAAAFRTANTTSSAEALFVESYGTGYAAIFKNINAGNTNAAMSVEALGSGPSIWAQKSDPLTSRGDAIFGEHLGVSGSAGNFVVNNIENTSASISATTNGSGPAVLGKNSGSADGFSGLFENTSATNNYPAIQASTGGFGPGVRVMQTTGPGAGMDIIMQNATSDSPGLEITNNSLGSSAKFFVYNPSNAFSAVIVSTMGTGPGGAFQIDNASSTNSAVEAIAVNSGGGAGSFEVYSNANPNAALFSSSNGTGPALAVDQTNNGMAIEMINGGLKYSVVTVSATGPITQIAGLYKIAVIGTFSLPTTVKEGTFCKVFNADVVGQNITLDPIYVQGSLSTAIIAAGGIMDFIFINGNWHENP